MYSPTRILMLAVAGLLGLAVAALLPGPGLLLPWAAGTGLLLLFAVLDGVLLARAEVALARRLPAEVGVGVEFNLELELANHSGAAVRGRLHDVLPEVLEADRSPLPFSIASGEAQVWSLPSRVADRGECGLNAATAELVGPLRLLRRVVRLSAPAKVAAIPGIEVLQSNRLILKAQQDADAGITRSRGVGRGGEFDSLAPYVPGDPPQSVDWRAYARTRTLAVRRYVPERRRSVMLACDAGRLMGARVGGRRKVDHALYALAMVAAAALQRGDLVGLIVFDGAVQALVPPRAGHGQLARIVRASLAVKPTHGETAFTPAFVQLNHALPRRALVVLATDFDNQAQGWELQRNLAQIRRRHVAIVAAMRDPVFAAAVRRPVDTTLDAYRQLASLTLLEERQGILQRIHSSGVHIIDAEPEELTGPLLNMYGRIISGGAL